MNKFWELMERSVIIQGVITLSLIGTLIFMYLTEKVVPPELVHFTEVILGFWLGSKVENVRNSSVVKKLVNGG